jgi:hypothetical protein
LLAPLAGAAALALLIFVGTRDFHSTSTAGQLAEVESLRDDMSLMTFRSQSEQLTVVWHQQRTPFSETASDITLEQQ